MRRKWLCALMILLCLLSACGKQEKKDGLQEAVDSRAALLEAGGCRFTAQLRADVGERIFDATLACQRESDGTMEMTVLAPESIEGVVLRVDQTSGKLCFDEVVVDAGCLSGTQISPAEVPGLIVSYWESGYIESAGWEDELLHVCLTDDASEGELTVHLWLEENGLPRKAELVNDGSVVAAAELTDVLLNGG